MIDGDSTAEEVEIRAAARELEPHTPPAPHEPALAPISGSNPNYITPTLAVLLTAGFFLRLLFYTGPIGSDDLSYFHFADKLLRGQSFAEADPEDLAHQGGRLVFVALVGVPAAWLGHVDFGAFANILLVTVRDVVLTSNT